MNLAIKHRPRTYTDVAGNEKTITELKTRAIKDSFAKVVLFTGLAGTGKSTLQNIYIKTLLCENITEDGNPCNDCSYCKTVDAGESTEYLKFFDGGSFGVNEADIVIDFTRKKILGRPTGKKIIVIDELQSIKSKAAIEKLLKILEKEKDNCYYVLGAMRWEKLSKAVKRRAAKYHITLSYSDIGKYLKRVCDEENFKIDEKNLISILKTIVSYCNGSLGDAVATLERVIYSNILTEEDMIKELKILPDRILKDVINGLIEGNINILQHEIDEEALNQISWKLSLLYKHLAGYKLQVWQVEHIKGLNSSSLQKVSNIINKLMEMRTYPYRDTALIEYTLINVILQNKEPEGVKELKEEKRQKREPRVPRQPKTPGGGAI